MTNWLIGALPTCTHLLLRYRLQTAPMHAESFPHPWRARERGRPQFMLPGPHSTKGQSGRPASSPLNGTFPACVSQMVPSQAEQLLTTVIPQPSLKTEGLHRGKEKKKKSKKNATIVMYFKFYHPLSPLH